MRAWILVAVIMAGCASDAHEVEDRTGQGRKNLAAIAALQAARPGPIARPEPSMAPPAVEADSPAAMPGVAHPLPRMPVPDVQVRLPWRPTPPAMPPPDHWGVTPPYTVFTPVVPAYPGALRCRPDYTGGQRC